MGKKLDDSKAEENEHKKDGEQMELIKEDEVYTIATREYLANGGDGFEVYKNETIKTLVDGEAGIPMSTILRNFFWAISAVNSLLKMSEDKDKQKEMESKKKSLMKRYSLQPNDRKTAMLKISKQAVDKDGNKIDVKMENVQESGIKEDDMLDEGKYVDALAIAPCLEHRIMTIDEEIDLQSEEMKPMTNFFKRLPSFVNMKQLPRQQSLVAALDDIEE